ncbi:MAG: OmpA family protein [Paenirhodobacter sp.]|uniref:OmpA family protein n=1 Tax=Paenirhodobacter sp. TaxID=1965326 RepID=UPI003D110A7F
MRLALLAALALCAAPALADPFAPVLPDGASISAEADGPATTYRLLIGAWKNGAAPEEVLEGNRHDSAWRLRGNQQTTLQILAPLRDQIETAGYDLLFECDTEACGGFDFRYALDLLPEPGMHVDLGDFRYLAARRGNDWLALTVSRSSESGFVHLTDFTAQDVRPATPDNPLATPQPAPDITAAPGDFAALIEAKGAVALDDLRFESGAATLDPAQYASLTALADYLATRPDAKIALVGHTDLTGGLDANVALSKRRAAAVRERLIADYGVSAGQLTAEGAGWLAPRASNLTPEGREKNRRVEAVLASTPR